MDKDTMFDPIAWANINNDANSNEKKDTQMTSSQVNNTQPVSGSPEEEIRDLVAAIVSTSPGFSDDYNDWLKIGFALAGELGEGGRTYFHQLSQLSGKYNAQECDKKYDNCLRTYRSNGNGVNISTLYWMAEQAGVDLKQFAKEHHHEQSVTATTATTASCQNKEKEGKSTNLRTFDTELTSGSMAEVAVTADEKHNGFTFSDKLIVDDLDYISRKIFDLNTDSIPKRDAMLLGAYNVLSGLMGGANFIENGNSEDNDQKVLRSGVYGVYDGRRVYAPLFNIIYSSAGNEKGNLIFNKQLATPVRNEIRRAYEAERSEYDAAMANWEAQDKKKRGQAPEKPVRRDIFVPGNSSSSAVYHTLKANDGWGLMYETEADTVSTMLGSDYGDYSDLMRKAHHHETLSMSRATEDLYIDIDEPRLSILLTCTPGQLPALFPSFENGLGSRFLFYYLPDEEVKFHDVFAKKKPFTDIYREFGDYFLPMYHAMQQRAGHPIEFVMSDDQKKLFLDTYQGVLEEQFGMLGKGIRAFVFRLALENFRYAMILTVLRKLTEWHESFNPSDPRDIFPEEKNALVCDDRDFHTAMTIVGCLINHTARVYSVMDNEDKNNPFTKIEGKKPTSEAKNLYMALPEGEILTSQLVEIAKGLGISERSAYRALSDLAFKFRVINPIKRGLYFKPSAKRS